MLEPKKNKDNKMTNGLYKESKMMGDPKFHQHKRSDPSVAERWKSEMQGATLGASTRDLTHELNYTDLGAGGDADGEGREEFVL